MTVIPAPACPPMRLRQFARALAAESVIPFDQAQGCDGDIEPRAAARSDQPLDAARARINTLSPIVKWLGPSHNMPGTIACLLCFVIFGFGRAATAQSVTQAQARAAAVHPVTDEAEMWRWLTRVPLTRQFPPDLATTLRAQAPLYIVEMTTAPGCVPCAHLWSKLQQLRTRYGIEVRTISGQDALLRSGKLGMPWVGHPVAWVRPKSHPDRMIPIAVGTDHSANLTRNLYLAAKMMTGVRPAVAVRAMSKFTGIVGMPAPARSRR